MISASKCKFVEKASYYQYNTEYSLNRREITLSQRISSNHHSFQLEKQIVWKFGALLPEQYNRQHGLKQLQMQIDAEKFSLSMYSLRAQLTKKIAKCWESTPRVPCKANFRSRSIFQVQVAI
ncbi:Hypothetical_protein [Hexamita inflata]|uniref:Hypothetical_protein n=1 Tax=Hexamita inflata TaxID=28002 RepID=A0AA86PA35_9EUKA|nr:Hypothetical protein HINF_LOCUS21458 [Hexamita inflata]